MSDCICSAGGTLSWDNHCDYCPTYMNGRIAELEAENKVLREFIVAWVDLDSFTPEQPEFKLYRECQSALQEQGE